MDLNHILIWLVGLSCVLSLGRMRQRPWSQRLLPLAILLLLGICWLIDPGTAGYCSAAALAVLVLLPNLLTSLVFTFCARRRFGLARAASLLLKLLRPANRSLRDFPQLIRAMELLNQQRTEEALPLLIRLRDQQEQTGPLSRELARTAELIRTRQTGDWYGFLDWLQTRWPSGSALRDPLLLDGYLQALGETGQQRQMLAEYHRLVVSHRLELPAPVLHLIRLKIAALCGESAIVDQLLRQSSVGISAEVARYWMACSLQAGGFQEAAQPLLESLSVASEKRVQSAALRRLEHPLPKFDLQDSSDVVRQVLNEISRTAAHELRFAVFSLSGHGTAWCSWLVAGALLAVFLTELPGGSMDTENLVRLGAMIIPPLNEPGDWKRIFSAAFLHFGPVHLGLNMLGLLIFAPRLERAWGALPLLVTYLLTAVGSVGLAPLVMPAPPAGEVVVLVGASGGVMGIIGALLAHVGCGLLLSRNRVISRDFKLLLLIVFLQMLFDASTPNVSSTCHLLGLAIGIACGIVWNLLQIRRHVAASAAVEGASDMSDR